MLSLFACMLCTRMYASTNSSLWSFKFLAVMCKQFLRFRLSRFFLAFTSREPIDIPLFICYKPHLTLPPDPMNKGPLYLLSGYDWPTSAKINPSVFCVHLSIKLDRFEFVVNSFPNEISGDYGPNYKPDQQHAKTQSSHIT